METLFFDNVRASRADPEYPFAFDPPPDMRMMRRFGSRGQCVGESVYEADQAKTFHRGACHSSDPGCRQWRWVWRASRAPLAG